MQVAAACAHLTPIVQLTDSLGDRVAIATPGSNLTVTGQNFSAGHPVKITVDKATGQALGSETVGADGQFTATIALPYLSGGNHTVVATQVVDGKNIQASAAVSVEQIQ